MCGLRVYRGLPKDSACFFFAREALKQAATVCHYSNVLSLYPLEL